MADEELAGNPPRDASQATPPHADDSPEMVDQPSPEEQRVTSSSDLQPPEVADSPVEPTISSTGIEADDGAGPPNLGLLNAQNDALYIEVRDYLDSFIEQNEAFLPVPIQPELVRAAFETPLVQAALQAAKVNTAEGDQTVESRETAKKNVKEDESDDSNQQFDVEDVSSASKSSPENIDFGSDSSPTGSGGPGEESKGSESGATEEAGVGREPSPRTGAIEVVTLETVSSPKSAKPGSETGATNVGFEGEFSSPKSAKPGSGTGATNVGFEGEFSSPKSAKPGSGSGATENVEFKSESPSKAAMPVSGPSARERAEFSSPLKKSTLGVSKFVTPEKKRGFIPSPKRKSPAKVQHLPPKRSAPFAADKIQKQSDSQMSTLLQERLAITKDRDSPGCSRDEQERSAGTEPDDSQNEESNMEVQEAEDSKAEREGHSSNDDSSMEDSD